METFQSPSRFNTITTMFFLVVVISSSSISTLEPLPLSTVSEATQGNCGTRFIVATILNVISYAPIPLYAESLRVTSVLVRLICSTVCVHPAVTGCIKDLAVLWNIRPEDVFEYLAPGQPVRHVVSLRHGNNFTLVNSAVLDHAGLMKRGFVGAEANASVAAALAASRPTILNVTFLVPQTKTHSPGEGFYPKARRL